MDPVTLGQRIREARLAAGVTQKDLAAGKMSKSYISRIEDGHRRPSVEALEYFASALGTTVESLLGDQTSAPALELRLALDYAELALLSGDSRSALEQVVAVEARVEVELPSPSARRLLDVDILYVRAGVAEAMGNLNEAIRLLEQVIAKPEPTVRWVRALIAMCRCYKEQGDFSRAIAVGNQAAPLIADLGLAGVTESIQLTVSVAGAHMKRGDLNEAIRICTRAIEEAEEVDSPVAKASAYWNASLIESRRGSYDAALTLAQRALMSFEAGDDVRNVGRLRTQVASMQLRTSPPDLPGALTRLKVAKQELDWSSASPMDKADYYLVLARAQFMSDDTDAALESVSIAEGLLGKQAPLLRAELSTLNGRIAFAASDLALARSHYGSAVGLLSSVGSDREAAELWFELAGLLDRAGDRDGALLAYRSAAAGRGDRLGAGRR